MGITRFIIAVAVMMLDGGIMDDKWFVIRWVLLILTTLAIIDH
jgi:hypothetical protein